MGTKVPLLNEYKREFFWKRFPQTVLGGPKLKLGYRAPAFIYAAQIVVFLLPWVIGGVFTILVTYDLVQYDTAIFGSGALMFVCVLTMQTISVVKKRKQSSVAPAGSEKRHNIFSEEDEVEFLSCFTPETVNFIIPPKKFIANVIFHSLLSGVIVGLATFYQLPSTINNLYGNSIGVTVILFIFGWIAVCVGQYSLSAAPPPETAVWRTTDSYEVLALSRPIYLLLCFLFQLLDHFLDGYHGPNQVLHIVLVFLPVLWTLGTLPPIDVLFLWVLEQGLFMVFGGSPMASDLRLILMTLSSVSFFIVAYFVPYDHQTIVIMAVCGYILSTDLGGLGKTILQKCHKNRREARSEHSNKGFLWHWTYREVLFHLFMIVLVGGLTAMISIVLGSNRNVVDYLGYGIVAILVVEVLFADIQSVYVFFGLWRNALYPHSAMNKVEQKKSKLRAMGHIRRAFIDFVGPLMMLVYLTASFDFSAGNSSVIFNSTSPVLNFIGANRACRWIWQSTQNSLLEISVAQILILTLPADDSIWPPLGLGLQLLILSVVRDRLSKVLDKLYFWFTLTTKSWADKKLRRKSTAALIALNFVLLPLVLMVIVTSAVLSAPMLPLFTLPVFFVGFPRPSRFWSGSVGASQSTCHDTVYYQQAAPQLARALSRGFALGRIGWPSPGKHYLVRFQDRLVWAQVLECGYCFCTISIKGMELQETSCHTVEAARIDDIIEVTFESKRYNRCRCMSHPLDTVRPFDATHVKTYSDAKNQLTGVIDSPGTLSMIKSLFVKTLVWVLVHHMKDHGQSDTPTVIDVENKHNQSTAHHSPLKQSEKDNSPSKHGNKSKTSESPVKADDVDRPMSRGGVSVNSFPNSIWSDDDDSLLDDTGTNSKPKISLLKHSEHSQSESSALALPPVEKKLSTAASGIGGKQGDIDDLFEQLDFGLPALDVGSKNAKQNPKSTFSPVKKNKATVGDRNISNFHLSSRYSSVLSLKDKWTDSSVDRGKLHRLFDYFSDDWFKYVVRQQKFESSESKMGDLIANEVANDRGLLDMYKTTALSCFTIIYDLGLSGTDAVSAGPSYVNKIYGGEVPWSVASDWLTENADLLELVLKAYRYAVKLSIDQAILGEAADAEELREYLDDYDTNWLIGSEKDPAWNEAIQKAKPQLFSLGHGSKQNVYTSHVLTRQETPVYISTLNPEAVHAQWANLSVELLYMTNDDEERYSIQAHPTVLRNLNVQVADPPLGYPIYASEPVSVPTL